MFATRLTDLLVAQLKLNTSRELVKIMGKNPLIFLCTDAANRVSGARELASRS
jgi:hypothetical protein